MRLVIVLGLRFLNMIPFYPFVTLEHMDSTSYNLLISLPKVSRVHNVGVLV